MLSICIQCGNTKDNPSHRCSVCRFQPHSDEDKARSMMLSLGYEIDNVYVGKSKQELLDIGDHIRRHVPYHFDETEVAALVEYARRMLDVPTRKLVIDGGMWLLPPVVILIAVFALLVWTK